METTIARQVIILGLNVGNALLNVVLLVREGDDDVASQLGHLPHLDSTETISLTISS